MSKINIEILKDIMNDHNLCSTQLDELNKAIAKFTPYQLLYKNGFANCKCGCEFESEGYQGEEYCPECGQVVWVGGYKGIESKDNIVKFRG